MLLLFPSALILTPTVPFRLPLLPLADLYCVAFPDKCSRYLFLCALHVNEILLEMQASFLDLLPCHGLVVLEFNLT